MVPVWDVGDRMRKALREAGIGVGEMAAYLGVARTTVSNWVNGRIEPSVQTLRLWALRCGVDYDWLRDGRPSSSPVTSPTTLVDIRKPGRLAPLMPVLRPAA